MELEEAADKIPAKTTELRNLYETAYIIIPAQDKFRHAQIETVLFAMYIWIQAREYHKRIQTSH